MHHLIGYYYLFLSIQKLNSCFTAVFRILVFPDFESSRYREVSAKSTCFHQTGANFDRIKICFLSIYIGTERSPNNTGTKAKWPIFELISKKYTSNLLSFSCLVLFEFFFHQGRSLRSPPQEGRSVGR
jgi:hypothetical protein